MSGKYDYLKSMRLFNLVGSYFKAGKKLVALDKDYAKEQIFEMLKKYGPWLAIIAVALVFMLLAGIFLLVTVLLALNVWFTPWVSALIMTLVFLVLGLVMALTGILFVKKGSGEIKSTFNAIGEDVKWLQKK